MSPVPDLTDTCYEFAPANLSGRYGVSVRAVDWRSRGVNTPPTAVFRRIAARPLPHTRTGWWRWLDDDRRLIRLKIFVLGAIVLTAALLEVPR